VKTFIRTCPVCQKGREKKIRNTPEPFVSSAAFKPFQCLCVDTVGELPTSGDINDYRYVLVIVDAFSRWIELYPTRSTKAVDAADALLDHFCRFGDPLELQIDRGSQFINELLGILLARKKITPRISHAYSKQENGRVERANKDVLRHVRNLLFHERIRYNWHMMLPFVRRIMNSTVRKATGYSPSQLVLGSALQLTELGLPPPPEGLDEIQRLSQESFTEWLAARDKAQMTVLEVAKEVQLAHDRAHLSSVDPSEVTSFEEGQLVLVQPHDNPLSGRRPKSKFDFKWSGPYQVVSRDGNTYRLRDITQSNTYIDRNVMDIIEYHHDEHNLSPKEVAAAEKQEYVVEEIVSHTGSIRDVKNMKFQVRWAGYDSSEDTFEPWENLVDNVYLHRYLTRNGMYNLVPSRHRSPELRELIPSTTHDDPRDIDGDTEHKRRRSAKGTQQKRGRKATGSHK